MVEMLGELELNKVYCMDALELLKKIPDNSVDLILIDPPYFETDFKWDKKIDFVILGKEFFRVLDDYGQIYVFGKQPFISEVYNQFKEIFNFRFELIWFKNAPAPHSSNFQPLRQHENIFCFCKKDTEISKITFNIDTVKTEGQGYKKLVRSEVQKHRGFKTFLCENEGRFPIDVIYADAVRGNGKEYTGHPTQKPLFLIEWIIKVASKENQLVMDCFMGSGTTAVACKQLGRKFIGCDISQEYVDIANKRLSQEVLI